MLGPALKRIDEGVLSGVSSGAIAPGTLYKTFFETPVPPDATKMRLYPSAPHPYVVDAPGEPGFRRLEAGHEERVGLTLVGRAATAAEAVLAAFDFAARAGIGASLGTGAAERGRARLVTVHAVWRGTEETPLVYDGASFHGVAALPPPLPPVPERLRVTLATPLRILRDGHLVGPKEFRPAALLANLVRRVSMMTTFHTDTPLDTDFRQLKTLWEGLELEEPMLARDDLARWSGSQQREIEMDGMIGSFVVSLRGAEALFPYLWLGQWIHAGKGAALGMGAIRLRPEAERPSPQPGHVVRSLRRRPRARSPSP